MREVISLTLPEPVPYNVLDYTIVNKAVIEFPDFIVDFGDTTQISLPNAQIVSHITNDSGKLIIHLKQTPVTIQDTFRSDPFVVQIVFESEQERVAEVERNMNNLLQALGREFVLPSRTTAATTSAATTEATIPTQLSRDELRQLELQDSSRGIINPYRADDRQKGLNTPDAISLRRGQASLSEGNYKEALEHFLSIIRNSPESPLVEEATFLLGECYRNIPQVPVAVQYQDAITIYQKAMELYPDSSFVPMAEFGIARAYEDLGLLYEAKYHYEAIAEFYGMSEYAGPARLAIARLNMADNDSKGAIEILEKILSDYSEDNWRIEAQQQLAKIHYALGEFEKSTRYFEQMQQEYPEFTLYDAAYMLSVGRAFQGSGKLEQAAHVYSKVINIFPDAPEVPEALLHLVEVLKEAGNPQVAQVYISELTGRFSEQITASKAQLIHGDILHDSGDYEGALGLFAIVDLGLHGAELRDSILMRTARAEVKTGEYDNAIAHVGEIIQFYPDSPYKNEATALRDEALYEKAVAAANRGEAHNSYMLADMLVQSYLGEEESDIYRKAQALAEKSHYNMGLNLQTEDPYRALAHLDQQLALYPTGAHSDSAERTLRELTLNLAEQEIRDLRFQDALRRINNAIERFPEGYLAAQFRDLKVMALFKQGEFLFNNGNYQDGSGYFDTIFSQHAHTPYASVSRDFLINAGKANVFAAYTASNYPEAIDQFGIYDQYLQEDPEEYFYAGKMAAQSYSRLGFYDRGLEHINDMDAKLPSAYDPQLDDLRALNYWGLKQYDRLISILAPRRQNGILLPEAYEVLAQAYQQTNRPDEALTTYLQGADKLVGDEGRALRLKAAEIMTRNGTYPEAIEQFAMIVGSDTPDRVQTNAAKQLLTLYDSTENRQDTISLARAQAQMASDTNDRLFFLEKEATALKQTGKTAEAQQVYQRIFELDPTGVYGLRAKQEIDDFAWRNRVRRNAP